MKNRLRSVLIAGAAGGATLFVWGYLAWTLLPLHSWTIGKFPAESSLLPVCERSFAPSGMYQVPGLPSSGAPPVDMDKAWADWRERHEKGPRIFMAYRAEGAPFVSAGQLLLAILGNILIATIAAFFLMNALGNAATYAERVVFVTLLGVFSALAAHFPYWNWMGFSTSYVFMMVVDAAIGWALAGLAMGRILKPGSDAEAGVTGRKKPATVGE